MIATRKITAYAKNLNIPLIYLSTDFVFEGSAGNYNENSPCFPKGYYAKTKYWGEMEVLKYAKAHVLRFTPLSHPYSLAHHKGGFVEMLKTASENGRTLQLFKNKTLSPVSSIEIFEVICKILRTSDFPAITHLASKEGPSVFDLAQILKRELNLNVTLIPTNWPENAYTSIRPQYSHMKSNHWHQKSINEILLGIFNA